MLKCPWVSIIRLGQHRRDGPRIEVKSASIDESASIDAGKCVHGCVKKVWGDESWGMSTRLPADRYFVLLWFKRKTKHCTELKMCLAATAWQPTLRGQGKEGATLPQCRRSQKQLSSEVTQRPQYSQVFMLFIIHPHHHVHAIQQPITQTTKSNNYASPKLL